VAGPLAYVLVHDPVTGPVTWEPVADELRQRDLIAVVPDLLDDGLPPFWRQHARSIVRAIAEEVPPGLALVLVAHGGGGQLLGVLGPVLRDAGYRVAAEVLVDAGLPPGGESRLAQLEDDAPGQARELHAALDDGGGYPDWTDDDLRPHIADDGWRREVLTHVRHQPPGYWAETIPTPLNWPDVPVGALVLSDEYGLTADAADDHGWPVRRLPGDNHFAAVHDADRVADELISLTGTLTG
jgi:hypothetical protein